jgi:hypothetical protein
VEAINSVESAIEILGPLSSYNVRSSSETLSA